MRPRQVSIDVLRASAAVPPHEHLWAHTARWLTPGTLATPCIIDGCGEALVVWSRRDVEARDERAAGAEG